jgi:hypothetical protein
MRPQYCEKRPFWILPTIILSQFTGTSLWFAGNAILGDLQQQWSFGTHALGYITSAVQLGFIAGTFCFAFFALSDQFSPRIGFFLAGIYPVGMKIAAGWYRQGLGKALGFLVGALVVGTAFPHLLKGSDQSVLWETVIIYISSISLAGGILMLVLVPDGPYLFKGTKFNIIRLFRAYVGTLHIVGFRSCYPHGIWRQQP